MKKLTTNLIIIPVSIILVFSIFFIATYREKIELNDELRKTTDNEFIELRSGFTEYEIGGDPSGIPVVLIHGLTVAMYDWDNQFDFLTSNGFRVLRYNQYGRGMSDRPDRVYNRDLYMEQLDELINYFFPGKVNLIGHSFGGTITAEYGYRYNEKVDKMIFIAPGLNLGKDNGGVSLIKLPIIGDYCALTILSPILSARAKGLFKTSALDIVDEYNDYFDLQTRIKGFSSSVKSLFRNDAMKDFSNSYAGLDGKSSLVLWGTSDNSIPYEDIEEIKFLNPDITLKVFDSINHSPNFEIPDLVNNEIDEFLNSNSPF